MGAYKLLIDGQMEDGDAKMDVINPATEEVVSACPRASTRQPDKAVAAAKAAFLGWAATPIAERKAALTAIADIIEKDASELARLLTQEQGKPPAPSGSTNISTSIPPFPSAAPSIPASAPKWAGKAWLNSAS